MGSYKLTCHGVGGVCGVCGSYHLTRCGLCLWGVTSLRVTVWVVFVGSYKLTWHGVGGVCGELQAGMARCGRCGRGLWGVTS